MGTLTDLGPVVYGEWDGVHGERMTADEVAAEVDLRQPLQPGVEAGDLTNVVTDGDQQALGDVRIAERRRYNR